MWFRRKSGNQLKVYAITINGNPAGMARGKSNLSALTGYCKMTGIVPICKVSIGPCGMDKSICRTRGPINVCGKARVCTNGTVAFRTYCGILMATLVVM